MDLNCKIRCNVCAKMCLSFTCLVSRLTQPNWIAHILAAHHRTAHSPAARWCAGPVMYILARQQCRLAQRRYYRHNAGPTLAQLTWLSDWSGYEEVYPHGPAYHRAAGLGTARWCAARLCAIRLCCVEVHPWTFTVQGSIMRHRYEFIM